MAKPSSTPVTLPQIKPAALRNFHARLGAWYATQGRHDLPWRQTEDPYRIWLSEVMLQQTQVATVRERFYLPFLAKFPTIAALADAPRDAVMKAWEGLGYYRRAGNLHEAAKQLILEGGFPPYAANAADPAATRLAHGATHGFIDHLMRLPGIGKNTAHAVAAFAYHLPVAILEANVKRIVARIFALDTPGDVQLWNGAETLLNQATPFDYNQAMMDLGSLLCTPKNPRCGECPANPICAGKDAPERYPTPKAKKQIPTREVVIEVREDGEGRLFLEARDAALLGGLYGFPQLPHPAREGVLLGHVTHIYSHFKLVGTVMHRRSPGTANAPDWHSRAEIAALPLSTLDHKVLALVENCHTGKKKRTKVALQHRTR